jgi:hypothetical protein
MDNYCISYKGRLANQLVLLYNIYYCNENINKIFAPYFDPYASYFNIADHDILCGASFYYSYSNTFNEISWEGQEIKWMDQVDCNKLCDPKFDLLKPKQVHLDTIQNILNNFKGYELISVHMRQTDYKVWRDGKYYFTADQYLNACKNKIQEWQVKEPYKILVFSDEPQQPQDGIILMSKLTGMDPIIDLFTMGNCNYFISTQSTFTLFATSMSKSLGRFKNNFTLE